MRFVIGRAQDDEQLLDVLRAEMALLDSEPADVIETTLVIVPAYLQDFFDYNQFLGWANRLVKREGWSGVYQLASFHPDYCFAGAAPEDDTNLTNRSPYPIIHIIREASLEKALAYFPDIDQVPERNQRCVAALSEQQKRALFPYLLARD